MTHVMRLIIIAIVACCSFFAPIDGSYYLIKLAGKANSTGEEILHYDPPNEREEKAEVSHAKQDDKKHAARRVSHLSLKASHKVQLLRTPQKFILMLTLQRLNNKKRRRREEKDILKPVNTRIAYI